MSAIDTSVFQDLGLVREQKTKEQNDKLGQADFLELMTAQLTNQDPLKPMENGDFLAQLAQFGTVQGIQDLQDSFTQLSSSLYSNQAMQASNLVGKRVLVPSEFAVFNGQESMQGSIELPASTSNAAINIFDQAGQLVRRMEIKEGLSAGSVGFQWDGTNDEGESAAPGVYYLSAEAKYNGQLEAVPTFVQAHVSSVTLGGKGNQLLLNVEGVGSMDLEQVKEIL